MHGMKSIVTGFLLSFITLGATFGQELPEGQKRWSATDKLTIEDFTIEGSDQKEAPVYSQFMISHSLSAFDVIRRNFNQKIENMFLGKASWIDTTRVSDIEEQIEFQQMQFDLSEVFARKFRERILIEKGELLKGLEVVDEISDDIMAELSKVRSQMIRETEDGRNPEKLTQWKNTINDWLSITNEFRHENKKKIKQDD